MQVSDSEDTISVSTIVCAITFTHTKVPAVVPTIALALWVQMSTQSKRQIFLVLFLIEPASHPSNSLIGHTLRTAVLDNEGH